MSSIIAPRTSYFVCSRRAVSLVALAVVWMLSGCGTAAKNHNVSGVRFFQQGQYPLAAQQFQQAINADPQNADACYNLAATLHRVGIQTRDLKSLGQAEQLYNQCLDLAERQRQDHVDCYRSLAVLLAETDRKDRAFNLLSNWVARNPRSADARVELARLYEEHGDRNSSEQFLQQAVALDQKNARAWAALGRLREQAGDVPQAIANYQRSQRANGNQPGLPEKIAQLQRQSGGFWPATPGPGGNRMVNAPTGFPPPRRY